MSGYVLHLLAYCMFAAVLSQMIPQATNALASSLLIGMFFTLLPDIDIPSSKIRKVIEAGALLTVICLLVAYLLTKEALFIYASIFSTLIVYLLWTVKHRGFFHTVAAGFIFSLPLILIEPIFFVYAQAGYLSHLLLDRKLFALI